VKHPVYNVSGVDATPILTIGYFNTDDLFLFSYCFIISNNYWDGWVGRYTDR
jgi:hypothetical protein